MIKKQKVFRNSGYKKIKEIRKGIRKYNINKRNIMESISKGFTLIEILVVIGIIAVLASVVIVAINPARQFKLARDSQRLSNITAILNAISQNIAEHKGIFDCPISIPNSAKIISSDNATGVELASCIIPDYISSIPFDPSSVGAKFVSISDYDTKYSVIQDPQGRITVGAVGEITPNISVTR